jgi:hypothetical protein
MYAQFINTYKSDSMTETNCHNRYLIQSLIFASWRAPFMQKKAQKNNVASLFTR